MKDTLGCSPYHLGCTPMYHISTIPYTQHMLIKISFCTILFFYSRCIVCIHVYTYVCVNGDLCGYINCASTCIYLNMSHVLINLHMMGFPFLFHIPTLKSVFNPRIFSLYTFHPTPTSISVSIYL